MKLPRVEILINWEWNPSSHRYNHYFFSDKAYGVEAPLEFISQSLGLDVGLNIPKQEVNGEEEKRNARNSTDF